MAIDARREDLLLGICRRVLGREVSPLDSFSGQWGDATLAMRFLLEADSAGLQISLQELRGAATIRDLTRLARPVSAAGERPAESGPIGLGPTQAWFLEGCEPPSPLFWNVTTCFEEAPGFRFDAMAAAVRAVGRAHDAFRVRVAHRDGAWRAAVVDEPGIEMRHHHVERESPAEQYSTLARLLDAAQNGLDMAAGPVALCLFVDRGPGAGPWVALVVHHLVTDGYSVLVLLQDLRLAYADAAQGREISLPPRPATLTTWAARMHELVGTPAIRDELPYWLSDERREVSRALDDTPSPSSSDMGSTAHVRLDRSSTARLFALDAGPSGPRASDLVLTAVARALGEVIPVDRLLVRVMHHGRDAALHGLDLRRTVGCLYRTYPVLVPARGSASGTLDEVGASMAGVPRRGLGYGILRYLDPDPEVAAALARCPQPAIAFNFLGRMPSTAPSILANPVWDLTGSRISPAAAHRSRLFVEAVVQSEELHTSWGFSPGVLEDDAEALVLEAYRRTLSDLLG